MVFPIRTLTLFATTKNVFFPFSSGIAHYNYIFFSLAKIHFQHVNESHTILFPENLTKRNVFAGILRVFYFDLFNDEF